MKLEDKEMHLSTLTIMEQVLGLIPRLQTESQDQADMFEHLADQISRLKHRIRTSPRDEYEK